jgi:hypothetical protein
MGFPPNVAGYMVDVYGKQRPILSTANYIRQVLLELDGVSNRGFGASLIQTRSDGSRLDQEVGLYGGVTRDGSSNFRGYNRGRLASVEGFFQKSAQSAELDLSFYGRPIPYETVQVSHGLATVAQHPWAFYGPDQLQPQRSSYHRLERSDLLCVVDLSKIEAADFHPDELVLRPVLKTGRIATVAPLGNLIPTQGPGDFRLRKGRLFRGRGVGWIIKSTRAEDIGQLLVTRTPRFNGIFRNIQVNPRP